mmetsp:Transcript_34698/g.83846  ORF Transcript_34698/g.83846 Transcript_34698/m.83846 type:complete len:256 (-) Transcript_34698:743-1510(-)
MVLTDTKVIDGRDHLLGRLASIVAKELLAGQKVVIVRCDEMVVSGSREFRLFVLVAVPCILLDLGRLLDFFPPFYSHCTYSWFLSLSTLFLTFYPFTPKTEVRNRVKYAQFRRKHMNTNPRKGPFHFKSPAMMVWRTIRGMVHQKTARGQLALKRLSTFDGIPSPYDKEKRVVVPAALRVMRIKPGRNFTVIGELADSVGWKHKDLLGRLESKRKSDAKEFYESKKKKMGLKNQAEEAGASELAKVNEVLAAAGY